MNTFPITIIILGSMLVLLALVGIYSSKRLSGSKEDVSASRSKVTNGFLLMVFYMELTFLMFIIFLFATVWFTAYNNGPTAWFKSNYFAENGD